MNWRSIIDLNECLIRNLDLFRSFDLIVTIPRSGNLAGVMVALKLQVQLTDIYSFVNGQITPGGNRIRNSTAKFENVLVIDDSVSSGMAMKEAKFLLSSCAMNITYGCVYTTKTSANLVDLYCEIMEHPRVFEWNIFHHSHCKHFCFDFDGVLCFDPAEWQNDDGANYIDFLRSATPKYLPRVKIGTIVTCRLEKYRELTEAWLNKYRIQYDELIMMPLQSISERKKYGHAKFKSEIYESKKSSWLFLESDQKQALEIHQRTGRPVICVGTMTLLHDANENHNPSGNA
jgi:uncharacterized HAD superfamily protein/hypoxanthine phosphoribosyltransferase